MSDDVLAKFANLTKESATSYTVHVDGMGVRVTWSQLYNFQLMRKRVGQELGLILPNVGQEKWLAKLRTLLEERGKA